jgi:hypothetical protein
MGGAGIHVRVFRGDSGDQKTGEAPSGTADLWFALANRSWSSLVLVPGDEGISASAVAVALAEFGGKLRDRPVTAIVAESIDFESARILADLQMRARDVPSSDRRITVDAQIVSPGAWPAPSPGTELALERLEPRDDGEEPKPGSVVVAIPPVTVEPLGVAIAQAASAVVLCVSMGSTRFASARRTIELIGADRIVGAFVVR